MFYLVFIAAIAALCSEASFHATTGSKHTQQHSLVIDVHPRPVVYSHPPSKSKSLKDSPYLTGRAELNPITDRAQGSVTFDWGGTSIGGVLVPTESSLAPITAPYNLSVVLAYPCLNDARRGIIFRVTLNGSKPMNIDLGSKESQQYCGQLVQFPVANNLEGPREVSIVKVSEPDFNYYAANVSNNVTFVSFSTSGGPLCMFHPLPTPPQPQHKIEFIGDSITCGYQVLCHETSTHYDKATYLLGDVTRSFAGDTCKRLNGLCHYECWSGRGVVANAYLNKQSETMPVLLNRTLATHPDSKWDWKNFIPDTVVINLGTNDEYSTMPFWKAPFVKKYAEILRQLVTVYNNPQLPIVVACGPMAFGYCDPVRQAVEEAAKVARNVHFYKFDVPLTPSNACRRHPDTQASEDMARGLTAFIKQINKWD